MSKNIGNIEIHRNEVVSSSMNGSGYMYVVLEGEEEIWKVMIYRVGSKEYDFMSDNFEELESSTIFTIVDDTSLLGYATLSGEAFILDSSVDYNPKGNFTPNQSYLRDVYGISEGDLKRLVKDTISNEPTLKR